MSNFICITCGTQFAKTDTPPERCPICEDERQYVGYEGQQWTTLETLQQDHQNKLETLEPNLVGVGTEPSFAIGQRALLLQAPEGNLLWDCISLLDEETIRLVNDLGGVHAIAISHPHYYSSMIEWAETFDAPVYLHAADREHVVRPSKAICFWDGDIKTLFGNLALIRSGGHFKGGTVLHWPDGAGGTGSLLASDIITVAQDRRWVSFMYSYPNLIPLRASEVRRVVDSVEPFTFTRLYGAWWDKVVHVDAKEAVRRSARRYIEALE